MVTFTVCTEFPSEVVETTAGELRACRTRFALSIEGKNPPVSTGRIESLRLNVDDMGKAYQEENDSSFADF